MKFRKQFILSKNPIDIYKDWNSNQIGNYYLYTHNELELSSSIHQTSALILLGDAFDYNSPSMTNKQIVEYVISNSQTFDEVIRHFNKYSGTFIVFYYNKRTNHFVVFNDATAQREVFFYRSQYGSILGSQPKLISSFFSAKKDTSREAQEFFNSPEFESRRSYVGDLTEYKDIKHLKPNHYLDINTGTTARFFPFEYLTEIDTKECAKKAAKMLKGYLEAASSRYKLLLPVSAGWDSRVLLAASRNISSKVNYYVLQLHNYTNTHPDIKVPSQLLPKLGLKLDVIKPDDTLNSDSVKAIDESISFPRYDSYKYILNFWGKNYSEHLSILGNVSEIARMEWDEIRNVNEYKIAILQKYPNLKYATDYYRKWIESNKDIFKENNYYILDMLYWEENCGNWVAKANTEAKMGVELFLPFNSRELISLLLSANKKFRKKQHSQLHIEIIKLLWSECLQYPINPGVKKRVIAILQKIRVYSYYRNLLLYYQLSAIRYKRH